MAHPRHLAPKLGARTSTSHPARVLPELTEAVVAEWTMDGDLGTRMKDDRQRARGSKRDFLPRLVQANPHDGDTGGPTRRPNEAPDAEAEARRRRSRLTHASHTRSLRTCIALPMPMPGPGRTREKRWDRVRLAPDIMRAGAPPQGYPQSMNSRGRAHLSSSNAPSAISLPFCSFVGATSTVPRSLP